MRLLDWANNQMPGRDRVRVYVNGELQRRVIAASATDRWCLRYKLGALEIEVVRGDVRIEQIEPGEQWPSTSQD